MHDDDTTAAQWAQHDSELRQQYEQEYAAMKFPAKSSEDFAPVPAGNHLAICNAVVDLGLQPGSAMYPEPKHQVYLRFELPGEQIEYVKDGQKIAGPMSIGRTFTASMSSKSNLRKFVESWRGAQFTDAQAGDFDFAKLLGQRCLLNVTHVEKGERTYANITAATPVPKGMPAAQPQHNASLFYDLSKPDARVLAALPDWLREKIGKRIQAEPDSGDAGYEALEPASGGGSIDPNDDIPFAAIGKWL